MVDFKLLIVSIAFRVHSDFSIDSFRLKYNLAKYNLAKYQTKKQKKIQIKQKLISPCVFVVTDSCMQLNKS